MATARIYLWISRHDRCQGGLFVLVSRRNPAKNCPLLAPANFHWLTLSLRQINCHTRRQCFAPGKLRAFTNERARYPNKKKQLPLWHLQLILEEVNVEWGYPFISQSFLQPKQNYRIQFSSTQQNLSNPIFLNKSICIDTKKTPKSQSNHIINQYVLNLMKRSTHLKSIQMQQYIFHPNYCHIDILKITHAV